MKYFNNVSKAVYEAELHEAVAESSQVSYDEEHQFTISELNKSYAEFLASNEVKTIQ